MMCNEDKKRQELICSVERLNIYLKYLSEEVENRMDKIEKRLPDSIIQVVSKFLEITNKYQIKVDGNFLSIIIPENGIEVRSNIKDNPETISAMYVEIASIQFNLLSKVNSLSHLDMNTDKVKQNIDDFFKEIRDLLVKINNH